MKNFFIIIAVLLVSKISFSNNIGFVQCNCISNVCNISDWEEENIAVNLGDWIYDIAIITRFGIIDNKYIESNLIVDYVSRSPDYLIFDYYNDPFWRDDRKEGFEEHKFKLNRKNLILEYSNPNKSFFDFSSKTFKWKCKKFNDSKEYEDWQKSQLNLRQKKLDDYLSRNKI